MSQQYHPGPAYHSYAPQPKKSGGCLYVILLGAAMFAGLVVLALLISSGDTGDPEGSGRSGGTDRAAVAGDGQAAKKAPGVGDVVKDGKFSFKVTKVEKGVPQIGEGLLASKAQGQYVLVHVTVKNIGDRAQGFSGFNQKLIDAAGREFDADSSAAALSLEGSNSLFENINPGNTVKGVLVFDVPKDFRLKAIELHDSAFSGGVTVTLS